MIMSAKLVDGLFVLVAVLANKEVVINKNLITQSVLVPTIRKAAASWPAI